MDHFAGLDVSVNETSICILTMAAGRQRPKGTGPHHYVFTIIATDLESPALKPGLTMQQMLDAIGSHALVAAGLVGRYGR